DLYDERDRVAEREVPASDPPSRALPQRAGRDESALPGRARAAPESHEPDRADRRLESYPEHPVHDLRRPPRNQLSRSPRTQRNGQTLSAPPNHLSDTP